MLLLSGNASVALIISQPPGIYGSKEPTTWIALYNGRHVAIVTTEIEVLIFSTAN